MPNMDYFFLGVYNSNGEIIAAQNSGKDFSISTGIPSSGTYYIALTASSFHNNEDYKISLSADYNSVNNLETEVNNTILLADDIAFGEEIQGQLLSYLDKDIFKLTTTS